MDFLTPLIVCAIAGATCSHNRITLNSSPGFRFSVFSSLFSVLERRIPISNPMPGFQRRNQRRMWGALDEPESGPNQHVLEMCSFHVNYKLISALMQANQYLHCIKLIQFGIYLGIVRIWIIKVGLIKI